MMIRPNDQVTIQGLPWSMIISENRCPVLRIMLYPPLSILMYLSIKSTASGGWLIMAAKSLVTS
jgi:hypothetical protein